MCAQLTPFAVYTHKEPGSFIPHPSPRASTAEDMENDRPMGVLGQSSAHTWCLHRVADTGYSHGYKTDQNGWTSCAPRGRVVSRAGAPVTDMAQPPFRTTSGLTSACSYILGNKIVAEKRQSDRVPVLRHGRRCAQRVPLTMWGHPHQLPFVPPWWLYCMHPPCIFVFRRTKFKVSSRATARITEHPPCALPAHHSNAPPSISCTVHTSHLRPVLDLVLINK